MASSKMGHNKSPVNVKTTFVCPDCNGDLELRKTMPTGTMNLVCKKSTQLPKKEGWPNNHPNFSDDCGFTISFGEKSTLEVR